jgi:hypothetical protein
MFWRQPIARILLALVAPLASAESVPWPPKDTAELVGRVGCDFPSGSGIGSHSVPVFGHAAYRLDYRKKGESQQFVLLMKKRGTESCDAVVVAALRLPRYPEKMKEYEVRDRFVVDFDCRYLGVEWTTNSQAFGIVDQRLASGYFMPRKAWRVSIPEESFVLVDSDLVTCARFSAHDDRGEIKR